MMMMLRTLLPRVLCTVRGARGDTTHRDHGLLFACVLSLLCCVAPAQVYAHAGIHERIDEYSRQLLAHPNDAALYYARGELYRAHQKWDLALADLDRAQQLDPALAEVDLARGKLWLESGSVKRAVTALDRYLSRRTAHVDGYATRARANVLLRHFRRAVADYDQAIAGLKNATPEYYRERAQAVLQASDGSVEEALAGLDAGIHAIGPVVSLQGLAIELEQRRSAYGAALRRLEQLPPLLQSTPKWQVIRCEILHHLGRIQEARAVLSGVLDRISAMPASRRKSTVMQGLRMRAEAALGQLER